MDSGSSYRYSPLDSSKREIRLVTLSPGSTTSDIIRLKLTIVNLEDAFSSRFEALSYVWGTREDQRTVYFTDTDEVLSVRQNLFQALQHLRYRDRPRVLWIDAIAINQDDILERSQQVANMDLIYSKATRVVAWLGNEVETTALALDKIRWLYDNAEYEWSHMRVRPQLPGDTRWDDPFWFPFAAAEAFALAQFFASPWFTRLWIRQEIQLGAHKAVLCCGQHCEAWRPVCSAIGVICMRPIPENLWNNETFSAVFTGSGSSKLVALSRPLPFGLADSLEDGRSLECSDDRDRVYALIPVVQALDRQERLQPNYSKTVQQVFEDVVWYYVKTYRCLKILESITTPQEDEGIAGLPSWVPDWVKTVTGVRGWPIPTCTKISLYKNHLHHEAGVLYVKAKCVAWVKEVHRLAWKTLTGLEESIREAISSLNLKNVPQQPLIESLARVLCLDNFTDAEPPRQLVPLSFRSAVEVLEQISRPRTESSCHDHPEFRKVMLMMKNCCIGRSLCRADDGKLGLSPHVVQAGDVITMLIDCNASMLLRRSSTEHFRVLGPCYHQGCVDGKALFGDLPEPFVSSSYIGDQRKKITPCYRNVHTGDTQLEDPRLDPAAIRLYDTVDEPRYDLEVLESQGLELEWIGLV